MSSTHDKRPASPGNIQPSAKQPKREQILISSSGDINKDGTVNSSARNLSNIFFNREVEQVTNASGRKRDSRLSENREPGTEKKRLNILNINNSTSTDDKDDSDIEKLQLKNDLKHIQLKELRIILKDMKYDTKNRTNTSSSGNDLWEVEKILGKKEKDGMINYLIKWKNWGPEYNSWEPMSNLVHCTDILEDFERERLKLLNSFKKKANFYPNNQDIEEFLRELRYKGKMITSISTEHNQLFTSMRNFLKQKFVKNNKLRLIQDGILCMLICDLRRKQLDTLNAWENEMNSITKGKPLIRVENEVDLEEAPQDFYYIDEYLPGAGVIIPDDPPIGCECKTLCNSKAKCCFTQYGRFCPYTTTSKIRVPPGTPIYECNKRCTCNMNCVNRVVQRGTEMQLCIFRTTNGRGWGVKTLQAIKRGSFVTQYVGEVITNEEADKRGKEYDAAGRTYLFDLDYNETEEQCPYTVDAAMYGNVSHFINHSCDPNLAVYAIWINCLDPNLPKLALFATRDIKRNEEITFDYMCQSSKNSDNSIRQDVSITEDLNTIITEKDFEIRPDTPESDLSNNKTLCKCGAQNCRRYLF
ncbi:histone-lysine N-methyltransferase SUV39H2 [Hylaeus anthracinus]|uniref:histone-lysine N-methyltransferase SUV39H2 n=1 Tax=Hylaeus anthracinus TaxID=313031 RepID=UPI0023BA1F17|nr:histone-lysine N-methyltransferase SUV39H2 [Hylaeus anthracinus]XP_054001738.1 histone-lysine N-methyltransferase SUV39H2 [Hylaeus anthracinus]